MKKHQPLLFVDAAKAIGIALVVYTHINQVLHLFEFFLLNHQKKLFFFFERGSYAIGHIGVSLFIVASGFGLAYSLSQSKKQPQWKQWFWKRFSRIYYLFWISFGLFLGGRITMELLSIKPGLESSIPEILLTAVGLQGLFGYWGGNVNAAYWFITLILCLYAVFPLLYQFLYTPRWWKMAVLALISGICGVLALHFFSMETFRVFFGAHLFEFSFGIVCARLYKSIESHHALHAAGVGALILLAHLYTATLAFTAIPITVLFVLTGGPLVFIALLASNTLWSGPYLSRVVKRVAHYSYAVYLFHLPFIGLYTLVPTLPKGLFIPCALLCATLVAVGMQNALERLIVRLRQRGDSDIIGA